MNLSEFEESYEDQERIRGAILTTPISQLSLRDPILVSAAATVGAAVNAMKENHIGCVLVERDAKLVGIFTERDVLTKVACQNDCSLTNVEAVMTKNPETLEATEGIAFALNKMSVGGYRHIPVVDHDGRAMAVLSVRDIVDFIVELFPDTVLNLPPTPEQGIAKSPDGG